jgi:hypothetical protein
MKRRRIPQDVTIMVMPGATAAFEDASESIEAYLDRHLGGDGGILPKEKQWSSLLTWPGLRSGRRSELFRSVFRLTNGKLVAFETCLPIAVTNVDLYRDYKRRWPFG